MILQSHSGRFIASYIDQFARAEVQSLKQRTDIQPGYDVAQCYCVAAQRLGSDRLVATADLLPPAYQTGVQPPQIPVVRLASCWPVHLASDSLRRHSAFASQH
jgi:hypothetical protein